MAVVYIKDRVNEVQQNQWREYRSDVNGFFLFCALVLSLLYGTGVCEIAVLTGFLGVVGAIKAICQFRINSYKQKGESYGRQ